MAIQCVDIRVSLAPAKDFAIGALKRIIPATQITITILTSDYSNPYAFAGAIDSSPVASSFRRPFAIFTWP
jgi:hypothetical protein